MVVSVSNRLLGPARQWNSYQVDDAVGGLLVADEEKAQSGVGSPGNVVVSRLGRLLGLLVVGQRLGLDGVGAEEEELLAGDQVPGSTRLARCSACCVHERPRELCLASTSCRREHVDMGFGP